MLSATQSKIALGSNLTIVVNYEGTDLEIDEFFRRAWQLIFTFESQFSRFLPESELSRFNKQAGIRQQISDEFRALLTSAAILSKLTDGLFNPFVLPALQRAGYVQSMVRAHQDDEVDDFSERSVVDIDALRIGDTWAEIPYGTAIDLGGCGKGYAGDMLADLADSYPEILGYWFSLGGDIVAQGVDASGEPIIIGIVDPLSKNEKVIAHVTVPKVGRCAVATSSVLLRRGVKNGKKWHHIIDPRTGKPSNSKTQTASVVANSGLLADVLASCAVLLESAIAKQTLTRCEAVGGLLQTVDAEPQAWGLVATNEH